MAGSADITGKQHYILGIGHPVSEATTEAPPATYSLDASGNVTGLVGPNGVPVDQITGIGGAPSLTQIADYYLMGQTPPDYSIDFTQISSLPAGVTATSVNLSSKGAYVSTANEVITIALATVLPSLTSAAWSVEVDVELGTESGLNRDVFEFGGTTNNRFTYGLSSGAPGRSISWGNVSSLPGLDVKTGSSPSNGLPKSFTATVSNTGTNATLAANNFVILTTGTIQAISGTLSLNLGATKSLSQNYLFGWIKAVRIWQTAISTSRVRCLSPRTNRAVVCWGDSLTVGSGASPSSMGYVTQLASITELICLNRGNSGDSSTQIKTRFFAETERTRSLINIFWVGRNNPTPVSTVLTDLNDMITRLGHSRYLVLSVINKSDGTESIGSTAYNNIIALNNALASTYGVRYLDVRGKLVSATGGVNDAPAPSITADGLHLTNAGYTLVAGFVKDAIASY